MLADAMSSNTMSVPSAVLTLLYTRQANIFENEMKRTFWQQPISFTCLLGIMVVVFIMLDLKLAIVVFQPNGDVVLFSFRCFELRVQYSTRV